MPGGRGTRNTDSSRLNLDLLLFMLFTCSFLVWSVLLWDIAALFSLLDLDDSDLMTTVLPLLYIQYSVTYTVSTCSFVFVSNSLCLPVVRSQGQDSWMSESNSRFQWAKRRRHLNCRTGQEDWEGTTFQGVYVWKHCIWAWICNPHIYLMNLGHISLFFYDTNPPKKRL